MPNRREGRRESSHRSAFFCVRFVIGLAACQLIVMTSIAKGDSLTSVLRPWIASNIHIAPDKNGRPQLFIRTQDVLADIRSAAPWIVQDTRILIGVLADAFRLRSEFTRTNPNLFVVIAPQISDERQPNRTLLRELGLPDSAIDIIGRTETWANGCGAYAFRDSSGHVSVSIVAADTRLEPKIMQDCILTGVVLSFGLRINTKSSVNAADGYYQYVVLGRALRLCSEEINADQTSRGDVADRVADCAANFMTSNL